MPLANNAIEFFPPANKVWGKLMFLHLSVSHSVHRGGVSQYAMGRGCVYPKADTPLGRHPPGQTPPRQTPPS